eukprot:66669-Pelagomonas_calceolata.AAC.7
MEATARKCSTRKKNRKVIHLSTGKGLKEGLRARTCRGLSHTLTQKSLDLFFRPALRKYRNVGLLSPFVEFKPALLCADEPAYICILNGQQFGGIDPY